MERPGEVLFSRGLHENDSDIWDDTALIKAYDDAVSEMKAKIAEKNGDPVEEDAAKSAGASKKPKKIKKKKKREKSVRWHVGGRCAAEFSEDGYIYEARIKSINYSEETCVISYINYENEEELPLKMLLPPGAIDENDRLSQSASEADQSDREGMHWTVTGTSPRPRSRGSMGRITPQMGRGREHAVGAGRGFPPVPLFGGSSVPHSTFPTPPPPPPAFPFMPTGFPITGFPAATPLMPTMPKMPTSLSAAPPPPALDLTDVDDKDALYSMLMSWYMSGYHTGFYQGLKQAQKTEKTPSAQDSTHKPS